jgi:hypothetical protein
VKSATIPIILSAPFLLKAGIRLRYLHTYSRNDHDQHQVMSLPRSAINEPLHFHEVEVIGEVAKSVIVFEDAESSIIHPASVV